MLTFCIYKLENFILLKFYRVFSWHFSMYTVYHIDHTVLNIPDTIQYRIDHPYRPYRPYRIDHIIQTIKFRPYQREFKSELKLKYDTPVCKDGLMLFFAQFHQKIQLQHVQLRELRYKACCMMEEKRESQFVSCHRMVSKFCWSTCTVLYILEQ